MCAARILLFFFFSLLLAFPFSPFVLFRPFCPLCSFPTRLISTDFYLLWDLRSQGRTFHLLSITVYGLVPVRCTWARSFFFSRAWKAHFFFKRVRPALWLVFVSCDRYAAAIRLVGNLPEYLCHRNRKRTVHAAYRRTVRSPSALHCCSPSPPFPNKNRTPMCAEGLPHFPLCERAFLD